MLSVETSPAGAAISVDNEYVGRSPVSVKLRGTMKLKDMNITAELEAHDLAAKVIRKKSGRFPKQVFLKLDPTRAPAGGAGGGQGLQQGGTTTTVQGPTIIMPSMAPQQPQYQQPQQYQQPYQQAPPKAPTAA